MTYCIDPADRQVLLQLTKELDLAETTRSCLERGYLESVTIDTKTGKCRIQLRVPERLPASDLQKIEFCLATAICIQTVVVEQLTPGSVDLSDQKERLIESLAPISPLGRRALLNAEWQWEETALKVIVNRCLEQELLQRENFAAILADYLHAQYGLSVQIEIEVQEKACCFEELDTQLQKLPGEVAEESRKQSTEGASREIVVLGSQIKGNPLNIAEICEDTRNVVVAGQMRNLELRELKTGRCLLSFVIEDATCAMVCKTYLETSAEVAKKTGLIKENGTWVKIKGTAMFDKYVHERTILVDHITKLHVLPQTDEHLTRRVELHAHTQMSSMDSVLSIEALIKIAEQYGHPAVAITDHGVVQAFPHAQEIAAKSKVKVIYGMEGYLFDQDISQSNHIVILAKNSQGLRNLYRLVSLSHLKFFHRTPRIPRSVLAELRQGLLLGSACEAGELFRAILNGASIEELLVIAEFYDYLEIQPCGNNQFLIRNGQVENLERLQELNRIVCEVGRLSGKPVVATGDVHFLRPEDEVYRRILMSGQKYEDADLQAPLYFRTTEEMLAEFEYLGAEQAMEVVIHAPRRIAEQIDKLQPIPDGLYSPDIPGADDEIRTMAHQRAAELYGDPLPSLVADRLKMELDSIINNGFGVLYLIAHKLVKKSTDDGYLVGSRGSVGSSFVATMTGITEVNPLPPHWRCPDCRTTVFADEGQYGCGFDLPEASCPHCQSLMAKDGHNIPFAVFMGFEGDKVPDIDLNFSGDYQAHAHKYTEELFGRDNVFRAGTISTIAEKTAFGYVQNYLEERKLPATKANADRLVRGCAGVKKTTGQHPGGIMVVPRQMDIHHFTPIQHPADDRTSGTITTHFDYHSISSRLVKLDILGHDDPTVIRMLERLTGIDARAIPFDDPATMSLFYSTEALGLTEKQMNCPVATLGVPEFGTRFVRQMLEETRPSKFSELVRISGFSHGTDVWLNNAQNLIRDKVASLSEAISARDDIMVTLIQKGLRPKMAFEIMESVRKGKGVKPDQVQAMLDQGVPQWFIDSCQKIKYMFPKAHAVAYVMMAFRIAWFKVHKPLAFYSAYFSIRAEDFDAVAAVQGEKALTELQRELESKGNTASPKEKAILPVIETAREMVLRGFSFLPVDIYHSHASEFLIRDSALLPPLIAVPGLGESVAQSIVAARKVRAFSSREDLRLRGHVSKTLVELLTHQGCLDSLPESEQMRLFG